MGESGGNGLKAWLKRKTPFSKHDKSGKPKMIFFLNLGIGFSGHAW
jgi:hypothetical protein